MNCSIPLRTKKWFHCIISIVVYWSVSNGSRYMPSCRLSLHATEPDILRSTNITAGKVAPARGQNRNQAGFHPTTIHDVKPFQYKSWPTPFRWPEKHPRHLLDWWKMKSPPKEAPLFRGMFTLALLRLLRWVLEDLRLLLNTNFSRSFSN